MRGPGRPPGGQLTADTSRPFAVRLPAAVADALDALIPGGHDNFAPWARQHFAELVGMGPRSKGAAMAEGFEEGKRQGWAHANKVFREALGSAAAKLKG
jgi:hypothetical protein